MAAYKPFHYDSVNDAADEIDAMMFSGDPSVRELDEIERLCRRWSKQAQSKRECLQHANGEDLV